MKVSIKGLGSDELKSLADIAKSLSGDLRIIGGNMEHGENDNDVVMMHSVRNDLVASVNAIVSRLTDIELLDE